jgi:hypothetical protein
VAVTLNKLYVKAFEDRIRHLTQQTDARLRPWVSERSDTGSSVTWPRMGAQTMSVKTSPRAANGGSSTPTPTPLNDSVYTNRVNTLTTYHGGDAVEQEDINQLLIDPNSAVAQALANAARRQVDKIIIAAALGNAYDETGATVALPVTQTIGAGGYGLTLAEIDFPAVTAVNEMFLANNVPADEPKVFVIGPKQARKLLHIAQATQTWYVEARQLVSGGYIKNWMGFDWILSNLLDVNVAPTPDTIDCFAMTRRAVGLHVSKDVWARVAEDPSISFAWRIYTAMTMGAVRIEDELVVKATFNNTVTP